MYVSTELPDGNSGGGLVPVPLADIGKQRNVTTLPTFSG